MKIPYEEFIKNPHISPALKKAMSAHAKNCEAWVVEEPEFFCLITERYFAEGDVVVRDGFSINFDKNSGEILATDNYLNRAVPNFGASSKPDEEDGYFEHAFTEEQIEGVRERI